MSVLDLMRGGGVEFPRPRLHWPDGARIAVCITVAFEAFERQSSDRPGRPGQVDPVSVLYGEYGGREGVWRVMDILDRHRLRATVDVNGLAAARFPKAVKALHAAGHEIAGHGWANDVPQDEMDAEEERAAIRRTLSAIEAVVGERPVGWDAPGHRVTEHTYPALVEAGVVWTGDIASDDVPYHVEVGGRPLVVVPLADCANDRVQVLRAGNPPGVYFESFRTAFDFLYAEAVRGKPGQIDAFLHAHIGGRPHIAGVFEQCIRYARGFSGVWFCSRGDVAHWYLKAHGL